MAIPERMTSPAGWPAKSNSLSFDGTQLIEFMNPQLGFYNIIQYQCINKFQIFACCKLAKGSLPVLFFQTSISLKPGSRLLMQSFPSFLLKYSMIKTYQSKTRLDTAYTAYLIKEAILYWLLCSRDVCITGFFMSRVLVTKQILCDTSLIIVVTQYNATSSAFLGRWPLPNIIFIILIIIYYKVLQQENKLSSTLIKISIQVSDAFGASL